MSEQLRNRMKRHCTNRGWNVGIADFMAATGKTQQTIENWIEGRNDPGHSDVMAIEGVLKRYEGESPVLQDGAPVRAKRA